MEGLKNPIGDPHMFVSVCLANKTRLLRDFEVRGTPILVIEVSAMKSKKKRGLPRHIYSFHESNGD